MRKSTVVIGKLTRVVARLRGGGSALPGLVVEKIDPHFMSDILSKLPHGVAIISGTNGKTTTTKIVTDLLESQGLRVFTNKTGSNFTRGVVSAILGDIHDFKFNYDIAVLELDEAHAVKFVEQVKPTYTLLLNVLRDQLDRFGEIDKTAKLLTEVAKKTTGAVVLNREDPLVASIACSLPRSVETINYGYAPKLAGFFPNDDELHGAKAPKKSTAKVDVELKSFTANSVTYEIGGKDYSTKVKISGAHNLFNAASALALVRAILGAKTDSGTLVRSLSKVKSAFGRGEKLNINGAWIELILVKNPAGFRSSLRSQYNPNAETMIAINDHYADGRDMSWLWDVDFTALKSVKTVSGIRAYDMALRLQYDNIGFDRVVPDLKIAVREFLSGDKPKQIFCTYTAMLEIRKLLGKIDKVERIL
ncbi:glutamate ligase [Alphaproteobacteria bacterium]|nr:glutamate ligase [Alphaproteobacteria bacterium]